MQPSTNNAKVELENLKENIIELTQKYRDIRVNGGTVNIDDIKADLQELEQNLTTRFENTEQLIKDIEAQSLNNNFTFKFDSYSVTTAPITPTHTDASIRTNQSFNAERDSIQREIDETSKAIEQDRKVYEQLTNTQIEKQAGRQALMENYQAQQQQQQAPQMTQGSGFNLFSNNQNTQRLQNSSGFGNLIKGGLRAAARGIDSRFTSSLDLSFRIQSDLTTLMKLNDPTNAKFIDLSSRVTTDMNRLNGRLIAAALNPEKLTSGNSKELNNLMEAAKNVTDFQKQNIGKLKALNDIAQPKFDFTSSFESIKNGAQKLGEAVSKIMDKVKTKFSNNSPSM
ncbi:hypothetical protein [Photobacterium leiognathi]|uniref:hypothetical protein n=1 Tax=Photobacterium leiognathi TaxID=553611 RepID=UPI0029814DE5|nr:hypothetical protein [Photobacterium leiognathi]